MFGKVMRKQFLRIAGATKKYNSIKHQMFLFYNIIDTLVSVFGQYFNCKFQLYIFKIPWHNNTFLYLLVISYYASTSPNVLYTQVLTMWTYYFYFH